MGSKGSNTTSTTQQQTSAPAGAGYIQNALDRTNQTANLPFSVPQAPVAGFSQDQQTAFQNVNNAQGMAQPYINQAQQYFSPQGTQQFLNPYASNVMAQMQNVFGQQQSQQQGQLTQAAGGIGADRIAVGQSELANQQGLAAGQTMSGLYNNAVQQAQSAGYGTAALGSQAQNAALQGAQAQLGTGGLQQQLSQAQMNSPYQLALAQAAFPYQQSGFLNSATAALAPGLGGTTYGTGQSTGPAPSMLSQILGLGTAGVGAAGSMGAFGGSPSYGGGSAGKGDAYGGSSTNPAAGLSASDYGAGFARGGDVGYDEGGAAENPYQLPPGFNDKPINIDQQSIIPNEQLTPIKAQMPTLNLTPPNPGANTSGGDTAKAIGDVAKMAMMFAKRGGRIGYADGGSPNADDNDPSPATFDERFPYRMASQEGVDNWRKGAPEDAAMAFSGDAGAQAAFPPPSGSHGRSGNASAAFAAPTATEDVNASSTASADPVDPGQSDKNSFAKSPWAALMAAGLGMAAGTSPFPMVNIGHGGLQGLKTLEEQRAASQKDETIDQAARRLEQEAKHHEDQYTRMTPYQKEEVTQHKSQMALNENKPIQVGIDALGHPILGIRDKDTGTYVDPITRKPVQDPNARAPTYNVPGTGKEDDAALPPHAQLTEGVDIPEGVDKTVLARVPPDVAKTIRAIDEGRANLSSIPMKDRGAYLKLVNEYDPGWDQNLYSLRKRTNDDLSPNGNSGKMILATNQLLPHLKTASDKAQALENSNFKGGNAITNWLRTESGDPRPGNFETVREVAAMDAARLLRGSGQMAEKDIDFWRNNLGTAGSPRQLQEKINLLADDLMGARISSIQHSYRTNMRKEPPDFVSKEAKEALATIKARQQPAQPHAAAAPAAAGPAAVAPAAAPAAPTKPATVIQNGHTYTLQPDGSYK